MDESGYANCNYCIPPSVRQSFYTEVCNETGNNERTSAGRTAGSLFSRDTDHESTAENGQELISPELKQAFESHLQETEGHVQRLEKIFRHMKEVQRQDLRGHERTAQRRRRAH